MTVQFPAETETAFLIRVATESIREWQSCAEAANFPNEIAASREMLFDLVVFLKHLCCDDEIHLTDPALLYGLHENPIVFEQRRD